MSPCTFPLLVKDNEPGSSVVRAHNWALIGHVSGRFDLKGVVLSNWW